MTLRKLNSYLDKLARPELRILRRGLSAYQVGAYAGLALALVLAIVLQLRLGLSGWVIAVLILSSVSTYFALTLVTRIIFGHDRLIYYHDMIAVMLSATFVLWLLRQPLLPYLDVTILGLGAILACGRLGCLMVSCCHGRPYRLGVCYREEHTVAGIAPYFVGVRLFPIQAVESLWVCCIVIVGATLVWRGHPPGEALSWYVITYSLGRFGFEFVRGDAVRPYFGGFSEAQWTSLVLVHLIFLGELSGIVVFHLWHTLALAGLMLTMIGVALGRRLRRTAKHLLLHPRHVDEVAHAVEWVANQSTTTTGLSERVPVRPPIKIGTTSLGIQISASTIKQGGSFIYHYALSSQTGSITEETVRIMAKLIVQLKHPSGAKELTRGSRGVFHLLIHP